MKDSWIVFFKNDDGAWKKFAVTDNFFYAMWIRDRMLDTGFIPADRVDVSRGTIVEDNGVTE